MFEEDVKGSFVGRGDPSLALAILESGLKELDGDIRERDVVETGR